MTLAITSTWHGRKGSVILGPTEARVARYLEGATRHGRVTIRTVDLASQLQLERSEAYRITRRLRILGLFGIENDKGGTKGGRRYWRTAVQHDGAELDDARHRGAWARVVAWARVRRYRIRALLTRQDVAGPVARVGLPTPPASPLGAPLSGVSDVGGGTFRERLRAAAMAQDLGDLVATLDGWAS